MIIFKTDYLRLSQIGLEIVNKIEDIQRKSNNLDLERTVGHYNERQEKWHNLKIVYTSNGTFSKSILNIS